MNNNYYKQTVFILACALIVGLANASFAQFQGFGQSGSTRSRTGTGSTSSMMNSRSYNTNGMIGDAIIEADYDTRSIIVITDEETNKRIGEIIKNLDRPVQQVLIKVVFLEVTYRDDFDFGVEGSVNAKHNGQKGGIFETMFNVAAQADGGFYKVLDNDLEVTLRAIAEVGKTEVLSRPSVLTRNNQEAVITVGKEIPFITNSRISDTGQTTNTVTYSDIGIILRVTPFITQEGLVEMILAPEISTLTDETVPISDTVESPVIAKRSADTVVTTPNGKTVVIGGMMEDNTTESTKKVPILGDIPLLGLAFQRKIDNKTKTELLIFLTPYVVDGPDPLVELSKTEKEASTLIPQAFSEEQLDRFFDKKKETTDGNPVETEKKTIKTTSSKTAVKKSTPASKTSGSNSSRKTLGSKEKPNRSN